MNDLKILIYRNPLFAKCPDCKTPGSLHRSRARNAYEQIIKKFTFFNMYRCRECGWRGMRSTLVFTLASLKSIFIYLIIGGAVALIVRFILTKFIIK